MVGAWSVNPRHAVVSHGADWLQIASSAHLSGPRVGGPAGSPKAGGAGSNPAGGTHYFRSSRAFFRIKSEEYVRLTCDPPAGSAVGQQTTAMMVSPSPSRSPCPRPWKAQVLTRTNTHLPARPGWADDGTAPMGVNLQQPPRRIAAASVLQQARRRQSSAEALRMAAALG